MTWHNEAYFLLSCISGALSGGHSSPSELLRDLGRKGFSNLNDAAIVAVGISDYLDRKRERTSMENSH